MMRGRSGVAIRRLVAGAEPTGGGEYVRVRLCASAINRLAVANGRVLDIGGGEGNLERFLRPDLRARYVVFDRVAEGRGRRVVGDLDAIPFCPRSVDAVCFSDVLEHVPDDRGAVHEIWSAVRPGGVLVVHVPSLRVTPFTRVESAQHQAEAADSQQFPHVRDGYSASQLRELLARLPASQVSIEPSFSAVASVVTDVDWFLWWRRLTAARLLTWAAIRVAARMPGPRTERRSSGLLGVAVKSSTSASGRGSAAGDRRRDASRA